MAWYRLVTTDYRGPETRHLPFIYHGLFGATAGAIAISAVQPADLLKTRMQLYGIQGKKTTFFAVTKDILRKEGFRAMYKGLSCAIFRQYTYGLTRFLVFYNVLEFYKDTYGHTPNVFAKISAGIGAGAVAAIVGTPAEVTLVRMTADGHAPPEKRRGYTHVFNAMYRISKEEGVTTLWRGVEATVTRAMVITSAELASYSQAREMLALLMDEGIALHFSASMVAGLVGTTAGLPVDIIKTRVQNAAQGEGQITVLKQIIRNEGVLALWAGFIPMYVKMGPRAVLTFMIYEQLQILYWKIVDYYPKTSQIN